jgi:hypothetical protein
MKANFIGIFMALMLGAVGGAVSAAESDAGLTTQAARMDRYAASKGQSAVTSKTAADFSGYYGQGNAKALAGGLRSGSEISLTTQASDGSISTATFTPPTRPMGNGNAFISMSLAQQRLTSAGITQPTAQQIQAAMVGGPLVPGGQPVEGVLQMRASGMGWGQIAHSLGVKLGHVISGMKSANAALSRTTAQTGAVSAAAAGKADAAKPKASTGTGRSGVVTAGGSGGANVVDSKASGGKSGIVTGAGAADGVSSAGGADKGQAHGAGIVTGGGGGQGNAYGKGGK